MGEEFGRRELRSLLGRGGTGEVWRALERTTGAHATDGEFRDRFLREADVTSAVRTPGGRRPVRHTGDPFGRG